MLNEKEKEQLVSHVLKNDILKSKKFVDKTKSTENALVQLTQVKGGNKLNLDLQPKKKEKKKKPSISAEEFCNISVQFNWSDNTSKQVARALRKRSGDKHIVESFLRNTLVDKKNLADSYFAVKKMSFINIKKNVETTITISVVYCKDIVNFINFVKQKRNCFDAHIKIGVDGGGHF